MYFYESLTWEIQVDTAAQVPDPDSALFQLDLWNKIILTPISDKRFLILEYFISNV